MSSGRRRDVGSIGVGVVVLVAALVMAAWIVRVDAIASATPPSVTVAWSGPTDSGELPEGPQSNPPRVVPRDDNKDTFGPGTMGGHPRGPRHDAGVGQSFALSVLPAPLHVTPTSEPVALTRPHGRGVGGGPFVGELSPITVVATGSLAGWRASVTLTGVDGLDATQLSHAHFCVTPSSPTRIAGNPGDVVKGSSHSCGAMGDPMSIFFAIPGGGGGTYSDTAVLSLVVPGGLDASGLMATIDVSVN